MSDTAMDTWARATSEGEHLVDLDADALGGGLHEPLEDGDQDINLGQGGDAVGQDPHAGDHTAEDIASTEVDEAARKAKKTKDTRIMIGAGLGALALVGFAIAKKFSGEQPPQVPQQPVAQAQQGAPQDMAIAPVGGPRPDAQPIATEHADGSPVTSAATLPPVAATAPASTVAISVAATSPVTTNPAANTAPAPDFGLQASTGAAGATGGAAPMAVATPAPGRTQPSAPAEPVAAVTPQMQVTPSIKGKTSTMAPTEDANAVASLKDALTSTKAELDSKSRDVDQLRADLDALRKQVAVRGSTPASPAEHPTQPKRAAPRVTHAAQVTKPTPKVEPQSAASLVAGSGITETVVPAPTPVAQVGKGKVRSDYRIYAAVNGQYWVKGPESDSMLVRPRAVLPDGTHVTGIDEDQNIVHTDKGDIR